MCLVSSFMYDNRVYNEIDFMNEFLFYLLFNTCLKIVTKMADIHCISKMIFQKAEK